MVVNILASCLFSCEHSISFDGVVESPYIVSVVAVLANGIALVFNSPSHNLNILVAGNFTRP